MHEQLRLPSLCWDYPITASHLRITFDTHDKLSLLFVECVIDATMVITGPFEVFTVEFN